MRAYLFSRAWFPQKVLCCCASKSQLDYLKMTERNSKGGFCNFISSHKKLVFVGIGALISIGCVVGIIMAPKAGSNAEVNNGKFAGKIDGSKFNNEAGYQGTKLKVNVHDSQ